MSKYFNGDYWDSENDPAPTRRKREQDANFLGWALQREDKWPEEERQRWREKALKFVQPIMDERKARGEAYKTQSK